MDRRPLLLVALVVLMLPSFEATAQQSAFDDEFNLGWEHNFGDVYITTAPLFHDDAMFVRTSASWGGQRRPLSVFFQPRRRSSLVLWKPELNAP